MSGDSKAMSERTSSVRISSDDDLSSHSRLEYSLDDSLVSDRESASDPSLEEASLLGRQPREIILLDDWSIHDFPVDMSDKIFGRFEAPFPNT